MLPYLIAGAIGFGIGKLFEEGGETFGRGGMTNEDILRSFLTSNRETQTNNLSTYYNQYDDFLLLRNYSTLIAIRKGNDVRITNIKYSKTTSAITNRLKALAEEMGYNVSYVSKFEGGGEVQDELYDLVSDFDSNEYEAFCYEFDIDIDDANQMTDFISQLSDEDAKNIINQIENGYFSDSEDEYAGGGGVKKRKRRANEQIGKTDRSVDKTRVGKPVGYRFSNSLASKLRKDKYAVPTEKQITKYLGKGIYKENRRNRSDRDKTVKL
jgi:hypothetical protein